MKKNESLLKFVFLSILFILPMLWGNGQYLFAQDKREELRKILPADTLLASAYFQKAIQLANAAKYDSSDSLFEQAATIYKKFTRVKNDSVSQAKIIECYNFIGDNWISRGNFEQAQKYLSTAHDEGLKYLGEQHLTVAQTYFYLGILNDRKDRLDQALDFHKKALKIRIDKLTELHKKVALSYHQIGVVFASKGKIDEAFEAFNKALEIKQKTFEKDDPTFGVSYNSLGNLFFDDAQYDRALENFEQALEVYIASYGEKSHNVAAVYNNMANVYYRKQQYELALANYKKNVTIQKSVFPEKHPNVAIGYANMGVVYNRLGKPREALAWHFKALAIEKDLYGKEHSKIARTYRNIGRAYDTLGDPLKALEYYNKGYSVSFALFGEKHPSVGEALRLIGQVYFYKGDYEKAVENYQKALSISLAFFGDKHPQTAFVYGSLANLFTAQGDLTNALVHYEEANKIFMRVLGDKHFYVAGTYSNIAKVYLAMDDREKALTFFQKALGIDLGNYGEKHPFVARDYTNIGIVNKGMKNYAEALEYLTKSIEIKRETQGDFHPDLALSYSNLGRVYIEHGEFDQAKQAEHNALRIYHKVYGKKNPSIAAVYNDFGDIHFKQNQIDSALIYFQKALTSFENFESEDIYENPSLQDASDNAQFRISLEKKAAAFIKKIKLHSQDVKDVQMALATYTLALDVIDAMKKGYKAEGSKLEIGRSGARITKKTLEAAHKLYSLTDNSKLKSNAFALVEKNKVSVLHASLIESEARSFAGIPENLLTAERDLKIDLAYYNTQIHREKQKKQGRDSLKIADFEQRHFSLKRQYENLIARFENAYPKYYDLKYQTRTATVNEVQQALNEKTALLEYAIGDSTLFVFVITKNVFEVVPVAIDSTFEQNIDGFRRSIRKFEHKDFLRFSAALYTTLLQPVETLIASRKKLVIIPDERLYYIPFEALIPHSPPEKIESFSSQEFLLRKYEISYHRSASFFIKQAGRNARLANAKETNNFIGFAPVFGQTEDNGRILRVHRSAFDTSTAGESLRAVTVDGLRLQELKHTEAEVESIVELFSRQKGESLGYFYKEASEENFKANIGQYKYVHIATHGLINENEPKLSGIVFSQPQDSSYSEDGVLYAAETYNLDLNADLVVLSSCESGIGKLVKGEGLLALTRGFLYAGAPNIVFSLWKVYDQDTQQLMVEFYKNVIAGKSYAAALRQAKLKMLNAEATAFPANWAAFVLV
ncbi:MAG: tetratricopeptide repeat protein, partial [bacterium]